MRNFVICIQRRALDYAGDQTPGVKPVDRWDHASNGKVGKRLP
jgi:hypothetical protein